MSRALILFSPRDFKRKDSTTAGPFSRKCAVIRGKGPTDESLHLSRPGKKMPGRAGLGRVWLFFDNQLTRIFLVYCQVFLIYFLEISHNELILWLYMLT